MSNFELLIDMLPTVLFIIGLPVAVTYIGDKWF